MPRVSLRRAVPILATVAAAATLAAGCSDPYSGELLLADAPDPSGQTPDVAIWAVEPGEDADDSTLVAGSALSPLEISTKAKHGQVWVNSLGRVWDGSVLLAYGAESGGVVSWGQPGAEPTELARSPRVDTTVLRRGAYLETAEGCLLAADADDVEQVGDGSCAISTDERWVASWPADGQGLTIRDLRDDSVEQVDDLVVGNAVALGKDARVLAVVRVEGGFQAVVLDATDGSEVGRTDTYDFLDVAELDEKAKGFVLQATDPAGSALLYIDTDAKVTTIDQGFYLVPVINGSEVTYLNYGETLTDSSLRRWSKGDDEPEELITGFIGAGSPDGEHVIVSRETAEGTEFWREHRGTGELRLALTLERAEGDADPSAGGATGIGVPLMQVDGSTVHLQVDGTAGNSYVRIDMDGDKSDVPVESTPGLLLESLDADGTALLTRTSGDAESAEAATEDILVVRPNDKEADVRTTVGRTATNLLHEGVIYLTETSDPTTIRVVSLRATGSDDELRELYSGKQIAGATWPQWGGATRAVFITPRLLIEQAQQAQQAQQQAVDPGAGAAQP